MATVRQEAAFREVFKDPSKPIPLRKAMVKVGYSKLTADRPSTHLTGTVGWKELMEKHFPDKLLAEKHRELLTVPKIVRRRKIGTEEEEIEEVLDSNAISKGLDMAYKLKGSYAPEGHEIKLSFEAMTDAQLIEIIERAKAKELNA